MIKSDLTVCNLTAKELYTGTMNAASTLRRSNSKRALLVFETGFEFIYALLGCFVSRVTAIPIAIPKPKTQELFHHFLQHAEPDVLITTPALKSRLTPIIPEELRNQITIFDLNTEGEAISEGVMTKGEDIAIIQYTSGSTSRPKGVTISFDNLHHNLEAIKNHFGLDQKSICFSWLPHYHDMGLIDGLLSPLYNQCKGVITSPREVVANPMVWLKAIETFRVSHTGGPNFILDLCVDKIDKKEADKIDLSSLSHIYVSAEPVRKVTLERFAHHFEKSGFTLSQFTPGYGLAEATLMVTCKKRNANVNFKLSENSSISYVGLGQPIPGIDIQIIDPNTGVVLDDGLPGEIVLQGPTITNGYYKDPARTKEVNIVLNINGQSNNYLRTGDIGLLKEGELFITGRLKDTLIIRGVQYFAEDIEHIASMGNDSFLRSACAAFSIDVHHTEKIIILQEVKKGVVAFEARKATDKVRADIFDHFGLPVEDILLLTQGSIPKTTSGKIMRNECKKLYLGKKLDDFIWQ